jgi:hypothetical protein
VCQAEIVSIKAEEEEDKEALSEEFLAFKGHMEEQLKDLPNLNPLPDSSMANLTMQFSDEQLADSEKVQELEENRKRDSERNKTISLVYLYAQPLVVEEKKD